MKTWDEVVKEALAMYLHRNEYAYFYGAKGCRLTDDTIRYLMDCEPAYFSKYTAAEKLQIIEYSRGKIGYDCSGFIAKLTGCNTYSTAQWEQTTNRTDKYNAVCGALLYTTFGGKGRHVGLDIGFGFSLSMDAEMGTINLHRHKENTIPWEGAGELSQYIDYEGSTNR